MASDEADRDATGRVDAHAPRIGTRLTQARSDSSSSDWLSQIRAIHDASFTIDWQLHLDDLNARLRRSDQVELSTAVRGLPPPWFNGDVEAIKPNEWVLVISLNPAEAPKGYYGSAS